MSEPKELTSEEVKELEELDKALLKAIEARDKWLDERGLLELLF